jgi:hypothetical protein
MLLQERQGLVPKIEADFDADVKPVGPRAKIPTVTVPASGSHETRRWREMDSKIQFRAKKATPLPAPPSSGASKAMRKVAESCSAASGRMAQRSHSARQLASSSDTR